MSEKIRILHLEDSPRDAALIEKTLAVAGLSCEIAQVDDEASFEAALAGEPFDLILSDYNLPGYSGLAALALAREKQPDVPIILISGMLGDEKAVECLKLGATDYVLKERLNRLGPVVKRALEEAADRHKRKLAEAALLASESQFRELVENSNELFWVRMHDAQKVVYLSPAFKKIWGICAEEVYRDKGGWLRCIHPEDRPRVQEAWDTWWRNAVPETLEQEYRIVRSDGVVRWIAERGIFTHGREGHSLRASGIAWDITERRRVEDELRKANAEMERRVTERTAELSRANEELARASRLKSEFLANMSHELRTPLNAILGLSESLLEQHSGPLTARQVRAVQTVESSGRHLLSLINDVLDVSKVEAGKLDLEIEEVDVRATCEASLQFVRQQAMSKLLDLQFTCETGDRLLHADPRRLKQILVNLLSNAVKFTPDGGEIGLEVRSDSVSGHLTFTVWDTGIGIAPEDQQRLFQPFVQVQSQLSREYEGTGLGLVLVQRLAEMHGGSVTLESKLGVGSRFNVTLPCKGRPHGSPQAVGAADSLEQSISPGRFNAVPGDPETSVAPTRISILLAEDNEANIQTIGDYLEDHGFRVLIVRNGKEAIEQVLAEPPQLVLMDIQMPVMDGIEAIRLIRADPALPRMPIIALTALAMADDRDRCLRAGADDYLSKPVSLRELVQRIRQALPST